MKIIGVWRSSYLIVKDPRTAGLTEAGFYDQFSLQFRPPRCSLFIHSFVIRTLLQFVLNCFIKWIILSHHLFKNILFFEYSYEFFFRSSGEIKHCGEVRISLNSLSSTNGTCSRLSMAQIRAFYGNGQQQYHLLLFVFSK